MIENPFLRGASFVFSGAALGSLVLLAACASSTSPASSTSSVYPAAYKAAQWQSNVSISFSGDCSMVYKGTGVPASHAAYYLVPAGVGQAVVATTPVSKMSMALLAYANVSQGLKANTVTLNVCPAPAASPATTTGGAIGFLLSGVALFNAYEATGQAALADNVTYTFQDANNVTQTASFLDTCASHSNGSTWHYHGVPNCVASLVDTASGPSHLLGFALDGYPIYGGRDINGAVIATSQLDSCNGITSVTPEFATAAYHYVLPIGVTGAQSSIGCFHGTVNATVAAEAKRLACRMPSMVMGM